MNSGSDIGLALVLTAFMLPFFAHGYGSNVSFICSIVGSAEAGHPPLFVPRIVMDMISFFFFFYSVKSSIQFLLDVFQKI